MVKKTKGKHRLDKFYHLAKEQGYRSRAAFKLIQLNRKYDFLSGARTLLDLCAAPGGWCQVAVKNMPVGSLILGVDLAPIKPIRGVKTFIGDITTQKCRQMIRKESGGQLMDVVLHDGAPNVGGAWSSEAYSQSWLVLESLKLATEVLAPKGTFVTKVFRSKDYSALLYALNQLFGKVEATKPAASRNASAEIFVVCQGYKAPSRIDPRLLDAKHIFQEVTEAPKNAGPDALLKTKIKQRRFREGYEDGASTTRKVVSAAAFITCDNPVELLGQCTSLALEGYDSEKDPKGSSKDTDTDDDESKHNNDNTSKVAHFIRSHPSTNSEIRILCQDLQVLGRSEFKQLLKWRIQLKKELGKAEAGAKKRNKVSVAGSDDEEHSEDGSEGQKEDTKDKTTQLEQQLLEEMEEIKERMERKRKREKRRRRELKTKARIRAAQLAQSEGIGEEDASNPDALFSLASIKVRRGKTDLVADAAVPSDEDFDDNSSGDDENGRTGEEEDSDIDSDEERRRYDAAMDEYLEESYRSWKVRQRMKDAGGGVIKKKRRRLGMDGELDDDNSEEEEREEGEEDGGSGEEESENEEEEEEEEEGGGLIVHLDSSRVGKAKSADAAANQWFSQDLFDDANLEEQEEEEESDEGEEEEEGDDDINGEEASESDAGDDDEVNNQEEDTGIDSDGKEEEEEEEEEGRDIKNNNNKRKKVSSNNNHGFGPEDMIIPALNNAEDKGGFEEVPLSDSDHGSDSGAEEFEALDDNAKAEVRALAKKFLRRKTKEDIMEAAYNRYAFHDEGLPRWFIEDERKFMRPAPMITAEEYKQAKEELRAIDARPIKKVAEAKARKRQRLQAKLAQARQKAESIANQDDVPMKAKMREIEKLYAKARSSGGKKKGESSRSDQYKKKGPPLDARMRKDKRGMDAALRRNKAKGRGKGPKSPAGRGGGKKGGRK